MLDHLPVLVGLVLCLCQDLYMTALIVPGLTVPCQRLDATRKYEQLSAELAYLIEPSVHRTAGRPIAERKRGRRHSCQSCQLALFSYLSYQAGLYSRLL